ncbi:MAG: hypothetical protein M1833_002816 [Piccolia ochrophora]|nr:MAG: hypothetical protein M1833_002816 [Piccolia ochrophora]
MVPKVLHEHRPPLRDRRRSPEIGGNVAVTLSGPSAWTCFDDMILWSYRGNVARVHAQLQRRYQFLPPISLEWVQQKLRETSNRQLEHVRKYLPGEAGTIRRLRIRTAMLNAGHDFFFQGTMRDDTPPPSDPTYEQPPLPQDVPKTWNRRCDVVLYIAICEGMHSTRALQLLRAWRPAYVKRLKQRWLEVRISQIEYLGITNEELELGWTVLEEHKEARRLLCPEAEEKSKAKAIA